MKQEYKEKMAIYVLQGGFGSFDSLTHCIPVLVREKGTMRKLHAKWHLKTKQIEFSGLDSINDVISANWHANYLIKYTDEDIVCVFTADELIDYVHKYTENLPKVERRVLRTSHFVNLIYEAVEARTGTH